MRSAPTAPRPPPTDRRVFDRAVDRTAAATASRPRTRAASDRDRRRSPRRSLRRARASRPYRHVATGDAGARRPTRSRAELVGLHRTGVGRRPAQSHARHGAAVRGPRPRRFAAPDLSLEDDVGHARSSPNPTTASPALVLRGAGEVRFAPAVATEQAQLRQFARRARARHADRLRLRPRSTRTRSTCRSPTDTLQPVAVDPDDAAARERDLRRSVAHAATTSTCAISHASAGPSSRGFGSLVVEFRSRRFGWLTYARSPSESEDMSLFDRDAPTQHRRLRVEREARRARRVLQRQTTTPSYRRRALRARPALRPVAIVDRRAARPLRTATDAAVGDAHAEARRAVRGRVGVVADARPAARRCASSARTA